MTMIRTHHDADHADRPTECAAGDSPRPTVVPHRMLIGSALLLGFGGLVLAILGTTSGDSIFDGVRSAAILLLFALLASFGDRPRLLGRIGYYFGLTAALVFGLNFARLGCKWFEPTSWFALSPPIALIMGGSCLFSFYKICRARRDYVGAMLAISVTVGCVVLSASWNDGRGLIAINSSYLVALFLVLVGAVSWRFQTALIEFFRNKLSEKLELAPVALIAVFVAAGAIKLTWSVLPQGAMATVQQLIRAADEVEPPTAPSVSLGRAEAPQPTVQESPRPEDVNAPSPSARIGTPSAAPHEGRFHVNQRRPGATHSHRSGSRMSERSLTSTASESYGRIRSALADPLRLRFTAHQRRDRIGRGQTLKENRMHGGGDRHLDRV